MNKFEGMPFEKCWNCKNMECRIQAVVDPNSKLKQGNYYACGKLDETLDVAWKECAGSKYAERGAEEQSEVEMAEKHRFDPIIRGQRINEMSWNDIRQLAKSYDISLKQEFPEDELPSEREAQQRAWRTKQDLIKLILQYESQRNS